MLIILITNAVVIIFELFLNEESFLYLLLTFIDDYVFLMIYILEFFIKLVGIGIDDYFADN